MGRRGFEGYSTPSLEAASEYAPIRSAEDFDNLLAEQADLRRHFEVLPASTELGSWEDVEEVLPEDEKNTLYRGIAPEDALRLMRGESLTIEPYRETENASFEAQNVLGYGDSQLPDEQAHWGTAFVGFTSDNFKVVPSGRRMAHEAEVYLPGREHNISISGELKPEKAKVIVFRFPHPERHQQPKASEFEYRVLVPKKVKSRQARPRRAVA